MATTALVLAIYAPACGFVGMVGYALARQIPRLVRSLPTRQMYRAMTDAEKGIADDTLLMIGAYGAVGMLSVHTMVSMVEKATEMIDSQTNGGGVQQRV